MAKTALIKRVPPVKAALGSRGSKDNDMAAKIYTILFNHQPYGKLMSKKAKITSKTSKNTRYFDENFTLSLIYRERIIHMFQTLLNMLFGDSQYSCSNRQTNASVVSKESAKENEMLSPAAEDDGPELTLEDEILLLARTYGPIGSGVRIELDLQEALRLFPRKRKRVDAYGKLIRKVREEYNAELIIKSRKTKNNGN